jgi:hypothetical protein
MNEASKDKERILLALYKKVLEKQKEMSIRVETAQQKVNDPESVERSARNLLREEKQKLACSWDKRKRELSSALELIGTILAGKEALNSRSGVSLFSLVKVRYPEEDKEIRIFVFPYAGGEKVEGIFIVSPETNLVRSIRDRKEGEEFKMGDRIGEIVEVK